jgi:nicotinamide riboside kinase
MLPGFNTNDYRIVSVIGGQSTGKSTFDTHTLIHLFRHSAESSVWMQFRRYGPKDNIADDQGHLDVDQDRQKEPYF